MPAGPKSVSNGRPEDSSHICDGSLANNGATIKFYRASEKPYGAFSNLYKSPIHFEGNTYQTAEHAYQAGKPRKPIVREWLLNAPTPALVAMAAHGLYTWDVVPNWSKIKIDRMRAVLKAKFTQHPELEALLLSTEDALLVECGRVDNPVNREWGMVNGKGKNTLGLLLMELRRELRDQESRKVSEDKPRLHARLVPKTNYRILRRRKQSKHEQSVR